MRKKQNNYTEYSREQGKRGNFPICFIKFYNFGTINLIPKKLQSILLTNIDANILKEILANSIQQYIKGTVDLNKAG